MVPRTVHAKMAVFLCLAASLWVAQSANAPVRLAAVVTDPFRVLKASTESEEHRLAAIKALKEKGLVARGVLPLVDILIHKSESRPLRLAALSALAQAPTQELVVVPAFMVVIKDKREALEVRVAAMEAYFAVAAHSTAFIQDFLNLLQDPNSPPALRRAGAQALASIANQAVAHLRDATDSAWTMPRAASVLDHILKGGAAADRDPDPEIGQAFRAIRSQRDALVTTDSALAPPANPPWRKVLLPLLLPLDALLIWLILLWRAPFWLWRINQALRLLPEIEIAAWPACPIGLRGYLLVSLFEHHPRVLDAWLEPHWSQVARRLDNIKKVTDRSFHRPLPILLNETRIPEPRAGDFRPLFHLEQNRLLIWGEGGSGKTSWAGQLAQWAMSESRENRLTDHRMLPVIFECALHPDAEDGPDRLLQAILQQARTLFADAEEIPEVLIRHLLRHRRVLVIMDHAVALTKPLRELIERGSVAGLPIAALIVTAQTEQFRNELSVPVLTLLPIESDSLGAFVGAYLKHLGKRELFSDRELLEACVGLAEAAGNRNLTVLLARLYADQMIAAKERLRTRPLPGNLPDLFVVRLETVNQSVSAERGLDSETVLDLAQAIAGECLRERGRPDPISLASLASALPAVPNLLEKIAYCTHELGLLQTVELTGPTFRFTFDPVAEYLGALHLVKRLSSDESAWRECLAEMNRKPGSPSAIRSFLQALHDCVRVKGQAAGVPRWIDSELARLIGFDPSALEDQRLQVRIQRLIGQLSLPNVEDRRRAVAALGAIGPAAHAALPALISGMRNEQEHPAVRRCLVQALAEIGPEMDDAVPVLIEALRDSNHRLRVNVTNALVRIGDRAIVALASLLRSQQGHEAFRLVLVATLAAFQAQGTSAIPALLETLSDPAEPERLRAAAAEALGKMGPGAEPAVTELVELMHGSTTLCRSAAKALMEIAPDSKPLVAGLLEALGRERAHNPEELLATFRLSILAVTGNGADALRPGTSTPFQPIFDRALAKLRSGSPSSAQGNGNGSLFHPPSSTQTEPGAIPLDRQDNGESPSAFPKPESVKT